ncbi:extracellular solute-binding protein [Klebsiella pneumoniae]|uniref:extracellular solute-binding protein n=1 Tax=Klebsiella pneumoniae TaxID=573 RepID=UPI0040553917
MFALLLLTAWLRPCAAQGNELVMATTFSPSATVWIIDRWQQEPGSVMIRTLNRTSASLEQLLDTANAENVDLILTSSPMLLQHLQEHQKLAPFSGAPAVSQHLVPESIRSTSVAVAISGFGLLMNRSALMTRHLPAPADWDDLTDPRYQGALLMSSPSRSDTNHLMVESLLQQKGWIKGWETLLTTAGNLVTISSRSFGVADKIKSGLGVAGPVIDNYANLLLNDPHLAFSYFPQSAVSPTYVAVLKNSQHASEARRFIRYLLSPEGQTILADANTGKYPVTPLAPGNPRAAQQAMLMNQPPLNYRLILKRQRLVQRMFDTAISFRLAQLKDAWRALHSAEVRLKRPLPEIRALLTRVPVDPASSEDEAWLAQFDNKSFAEQQIFENERTLLQMTLGKVISRIHHIGSTSVPGLSAKPVIDILIEVANLEELDRLNQAMEGVGYTVRGENGILNRRYFTKGGNQRSHHIHAFATGDAQIIKHLAFRDYLIKHNDVAIQYALMKKSAMLLCENDSHRYSIYKADFIQKHLRMALIDAGHLG